MFTTKIYKPELLYLLFEYLLEKHQEGHHYRHDYSSLYHYYYRCPRKNVIFWADGE